jgi:hypothetical protein
MAMNDELGRMYYNNNLMAYLKHLPGGNHNNFRISNSLDEILNQKHFTLLYFTAWKQIIHFIFVFILYLI